MAEIYDNNTILSSDLYKVTDFVNELKKKHIPENEDTLMMTTFGYLGDLATKIIQSSIIVGSEWANEVFPINAKYDRNILKHAVGFNITDINAIPSSMNIYLCISEKQLISNMGLSDVFILDKKTEFKFGKYEFHLDYNLKVERNKTATGDTIYIAQYIIDNINSLSDINTPYLLPPKRLLLNGEIFIFIECKIRQVEFQRKERKVLSNDHIENKSFIFEFDSQLADFDITIEKPDGSHIIMYPLLDGTPIANKDKYHFYYQYITSNKIQVKFIYDSYEPSLNDKIVINIRSTQGADGIFTYSENIFTTPESDIYKYNDISLLITPLSDSNGGINRKDINDLKKIIPRESISRKSITKDKDLELFFKELDTENDKIKIFKKYDNQFMRLYYGYSLLRDINNVIIPTNTINVQFHEENCDEVTSERLVIRPGCKMELAGRGQYANLIKTNWAADSFKYTSPFLIILSKATLTLAYYLTVFNLNYRTKFNYINDKCFLQFISTKINNRRQFLTDTNKYKTSLILSQNTNEEQHLVTINNSNVITDSKIKTFLIFHDANDAPCRYIECPITDYNSASKEYEFKTELITDDVLDNNSNIKITNLMELNTTVAKEVFLPRQTKVVMYILCKFDKGYGRDDTDNFIPGMQGWSLCNKYETDPGLELFINYSEIINSTVQVESVQQKDLYKVDSVPVIGFDYIQTEEKFGYFIDSLIDRKLYIDDAIRILENSFGIDFKFFNTYGPSSLFRIGYDKALLDRTDITMKFRVIMNNTADNNTIDLIILDIKKYIENINEVNNVYISQLLKEITTKYDSVINIEFVSINGFDARYQYIKNEAGLIGDNVPEFINIRTTSNNTPEIEIQIV